MPSSISNSNDRLPTMLVGRVWLAALLVFATSLGAIEVFARARGYDPMVRDTKELWCYHRERASRAGDNALVLIGASRMQNGIVPEELAVQFPKKEVAMLALSGHDTRAILENLAADETFTGTVICSTTALWLEGEYFWQTLTPYIDFYEREWSIESRLSTRVHLRLQDRLSLLHEGFSFEAIQDRLSGKPYQNFTHSRASRFREVHWSKTDDIMKKKARANSIYRDTFEASPFPRPDEMLEHYASVERFVRQLQAKGCRVIFVRLPSSGQVWELEQQYTPKALYWDRFAQLTKAETYHFKDYPTLQGFECSDNTHLDYADAVLFTRAFADLLRARGGEIEERATRR